MQRAFILSFLRDLADNNSKAWMDVHRAEYHRARADYTAFVAELIKGLQQLEPDLLGLTPQEVMFRINKNDRFQQSDEPYKRHMGAGIKRGGRHSQWAGYFVALQPGGETYVGAGRWQPEAEQLARIRQEIHYNPAEFHALRQNPELLHHFPSGLDMTQTLKTAPKGYDRTDPDIEWLRLKSFFVWQSFSDKEVLRPDFLARVLAAWQAAQPFVHFLNEAMQVE
ncbi:DUF2461 domain-containing protein [Hymenobacter taeanensis]|uniref:DUF2461 domain-containing protein n=1 Tax=Hymenobacter taeanensis TaxID=2735321 RepID=A0A6M6BKU6_9BACT|nr:MULTISPECIES: DUF2461 domain-containing protein [Hymenobacter]QJX47685.1 DUF2461 domain-containing protein [Hymenobacter taeanensis]UOQ82831.1 DUF2461 domain-containing protein [Hymenobacter sp. 5414T-23]